jgi:hypothetical protein
MVPAVLVMVPLHIPLQQLIFVLRELLLLFLEQVPGPGLAMDHIADCLLSVLLIRSLMVPAVLVTVPMPLLFQPLIFVVLDMQLVLPEQVLGVGPVQEYEVEQQQPVKLVVFL